MLHTWGQTLSQHVHLHCLIPGGAFSPQGRWHPAKSTYLFPVRALSRHIRGGFVSRLRRHLEDGKLPRIEDPAQIGALLDTLMAQRLGGLLQALSYPHRHGSGVSGALQPPHRLDRRTDP